MKTPTNIGTALPTETSSLLPVAQYSRPLDQQPGNPKDTDKTKRGLRILPALAIGVFLAAADQTIVVSSYGKIGSDLNALDSTSWLATGYLLTLSSFQLLYGKLSDIFGRKILLLIAFGTFGLGCLLCGFARSMKELIAARAVAGIGGGGFNTLAVIILSDAIPLRERATWQGYRNLVFAAGLGVGTLAGGFLADSIGWRWSFFLQLPLIVLGAVNVYFVLDNPTADGSDWRHKLKRVDFSGALCIILAVSTLLIGLDQGSNNISWLSLITLSCLSSSLLFTITFLYIELYVTAEPLAPMHLLREMSLAACSLANFFAYACSTATVYYLPLYWQAAEGLSATQAALRLLPGNAAGVMGSLGAGVMMQKSGKYYWLTVSAYSAFVVGAALNIIFTGWVTKSLWGVWAGTILASGSLNVGSTTTIVALLASTSPKDQAVAISCLHLFRSLGSEIGLALSAAIVQGVLRKELNTELKGNADVESIIEHVRESLEFLDGLEPDVRGAVRLCYEVAVRWSLCFGGLMAVGSLLGCLFMRERKLG